MHISIVWVPKKRIYKNGIKRLTTPLVDSLEKNLHLSLNLTG